MSFAEANFFYNEQLAADRQNAIFYLFTAAALSVGAPTKVSSPYFNPNSRLDMIEKNLLENGITFKPLHGSLTAIKINGPEDFISMPSKFGMISPSTMYEFLRTKGYNPQPLNDGSLKGIPFEQGGGYKVNWGGDRILQYHPAGNNHHGGEAYWKISSGPTGIRHYNLEGQPIL